MDRYSSGEENGQNPEPHEQDINDFALQTLSVLERYAAQDTHHTVTGKNSSICNLLSSLFLNTFC